MKQSFKVKKIKGRYHVIGSNDAKKSLKDFDTAKDAYAHIDSIGGVTAKFSTIDGDTSQFADMSFGQITSMVTTAIRNKLSLGKDGYMYIRDIWSTTAVYNVSNYSSSEGSDTYSIDYSIVDNKVTLGKATKVVPVTSYEAVTMSGYTFDVTDKDASNDEVVILRGKIFNTGSFVDKRFSLDENELSEAVQKFEPVKIDYEHINGPLDGLLGNLTDVWTNDNKTLFGAVELPSWLDKQIGDKPIKVSTTWSKDPKRIIGLALVTNPRIDDAAIFAGARHSASDQKRVQEMHDHSVALGATCDGSDDSSTKTAQSSKDEAQTKGSTKMSGSPKRNMVREFFSALMGDELPEDTIIITSNDADGKPLDVGKIENVAAPLQKVETKDDPRIATMSGEMAALRRERANDQAVAFANTLVRDHKITPADSDAVVEDFMHAYDDDVSTGTKIKFSAKGETIEGSRVDRFKARMDAKPTNDALFNEQLGNGELNVLGSGKVDNDAEPTQAELDTLYEKTPMGRKILAERKAANKG